MAKIIKKKKLATDWKKVSSDWKKKFSNLSVILKDYESTILDLRSDKNSLNELNNSVRRELSRVACDLVRSRDERYESLSSNLVGCLSKAEIDAANISGCSPEIYAIELLKIFQAWKKKPKESTDIQYKHLYTN